MKRIPVSYTHLYGGSSSDAPSQSAPPVSVTVNGIATTTTLTASATTLTFGQTLTLTATVAAASGGTPTGTVTFLNGTTSLGTAPLNGSGVGSLVLTPPVGVYSLTASYGGSSSDSASVSSPPITVTVISTATTTTLTPSLNPAPFGASVTFTAAVVTSAGIPAGTVSFYDGPSLLATSTLASGAATYSTSSLSVGLHNMTAVYAGAVGYSPSTSNTLAEVISAADFSISAAPGSQSVYTGEAASYAVAVTPGTGFDLPVALDVYKRQDQGRSGEDGEPGANMRALRRRRPCARGGHQLSAGPGRPGACCGGGDCGGAAGEKPAGLGQSRAPRRLGAGCRFR